MVGYSYRRTVHRHNMSTIEGPSVSAVQREQLRVAPIVEGLCLQSRGPNSSSAALRRSIQPSNYGRGIGGAPPLLLGTGTKNQARKKHRQDETQDHVYEGVVELASSGVLDGSSIRHLPIPPEPQQGILSRQPEAPGSKTVSRFPIRIGASLPFLRTDSLHK